MKKPYEKPEIIMNTFKNTCVLSVSDWNDENVDGDGWLW